MALQRIDALGAIDVAFPSSPLVLTLGGTIREMLAAVGRKPNHLYSLDAMGQTLGIGLGLAVGLEDQRSDKLVIVEGDGSLLMGFSTLATVGHLKPKNLLLIVLDNGVYLATGGQPTAARDVDYAAVALACGWAYASDVEPAALESALADARDREGPVLLRVAVGTEQPKTDYFLEDPVVLAHDFTEWLARG